MNPKLTPRWPAGCRPGSPRRPLENLLLGAMPAEVQERLLPGLELVHLSDGEVLYESGDELRYVHFPTDSIVSLACATADGESMEISAVGNEGMVGISASLGGQAAPNRAGWITVLDRPGLEKLSCECYAVVKAETERLLPYLDHHEDA